MLGLLRVSYRRHHTAIVAAGLRGGAVCIAAARVIADHVGRGPVIEGNAGAEVLAAGQPCHRHKKATGIIHGGRLPSPSLSLKARQPHHLPRGTPSTHLNRILLAGCCSAGTTCPDSDTRDSAPCISLSLTAMPSCTVCSRTADPLLPRQPPSTHEMPAVSCSRRTTESLTNYNQGA